MADIKDGSHHHENGKGVKKRGGCASHCKRFWWIYLIVAILIILLVVLLIIFVAIPKIAQQKMDDSELTVDGILISDTKANSYQMGVNSTIRTDGKIHARIDGFKGQMYLEDKEPHQPFATIDFPETTSDKVSTVNVSQHIDIADMGSFTTFNTWLLNNETLRLTITGDTHVHVKGLSKAYGVTFRKTVELKGLNGFKGLEVTNPNVTLATKNNFHADVIIPNPSVLTIEIGNASFHNYLLGQDIGTVFMDNLILRPGNNNVSIHADIQQGPVLTNILKDPYCKDGNMEFQMRGKDVKNQGEDITYFRDALASANQTVSIQIGSALKAINFPVECKS